jgi:hypothetical protein
MALSTAQIVRKQIEGIEPGIVFGFSRFNLKATGELSLAKALSRLAKEGVIVRLAKGKYYRPKTSLFGKLRPSEAAVVEALTVRNKERIGYLTGPVVYNKLGLTSQISNTLVIATNKPLPPKVIEGYKVKYVKREIDIKDSDIPLLQILDALRDVKSIPDTTADEALKVLINKIKALLEEQQRRLTRIAMEWNASTRALLGALFEQYIPSIPVSRLNDSLNKLSKYEIGVSETVLPNKNNWNIK